MRSLSIILLFFSSCYVQAADDLSVPENLDFYKTGFSEAPIIQCPRPKKKYEDMLTQLNSLKAKIKSEACQASAAEANSQVSSLETLIVGGRKNFIGLIKKGTSANQQLTAQEVANVQKYIDQVVKKAASVTGLLSNEACFDEKSKQSTLGFLSSLIGEVSGAVGALTGPFGAKISLGGKLAAGLLGSIDSIVQARKTYDYETHEDRRNYLHNLCAYYEFKSDIDKETGVFAFYDRLYELLESSDKFLGYLENSCDECRLAIEEYDQKVLSGEGFVVERTTPVETSSSSDLAPISAVGPEGEPYVSFPTEDGMRNFVNAASVTDSELLGDLFGRAMAEELVMEGDSGGDNYQFEKQSQLSFNPRLMTVRALQAKSWVEEEIRSLQMGDSEGLSDDGRREVMRVQKQLESFLVDREAVNYIRFYQKLLRRDYKDLERVLFNVASLLQNNFVERDPGYNYMDYKKYNAHVVHDLFRHNLDFTSVLTRNLQPERVQDLLKKFKMMFLEKLEPVRVDYSIIVERCEFFTKSLFNSHDSIRYACNRALKKNSDVVTFLKSLKDTSLSVRYSPFIKLPVKGDTNYSSDWLGSITSAFSIYSEQLK